MVKTSGGQHSAFDDAEIPLQRTKIPENDRGVSYRIWTAGLYCRVERGKVIVAYFLTGLGLVVHFDGIGATPIERVARINPGLYLQSSQECLHCSICLFQSVPLTFPHDHNS